jgi:hypothetical protein
MKGLNRFNEVDAIVVDETSITRWYDTVKI